MTPPNDQPPSIPKAQPSHSGGFANFWERFGSTFKFFLIGFLVLIMLIPLMFVGSLVNERKQRAASVESNISQHWGAKQGLIGPVLMIPTRHQVTEANGKTKTVTTYEMLLPQTLMAGVVFTPEVRQRGVFKTIVYTAKLKLMAQFAPRPATRIEKTTQQDTAHALMAFSLNDVTGLRNTTLSLNAHEVELSPTSNYPGIVATVDATPLTHGKPSVVQFETTFNGSKLFGIAPVGKLSTITMRASGVTPSFTGSYLPTQRTVSNKGFSATWQVSYLSRRFPEKWLQSDTRLEPIDVDALAQASENNSDASEYSNLSSMSNAEGVLSQLKTSGLGVLFIRQGNAYQQIDRVMKYGILFFAMTFLTYFLFELMSKVKIHVLQYVMVGLALSLFYLLLLSFSEVVGFEWAYLIGSIGVVGLISFYSSGFVAKRQQWIIPVILIGIYVYLYTLLQLEDFSLLFGTLGLFIVLAILMQVTRRMHVADSDVASASSPIDER
jgi:inner membrane protein